jgi:hypothetical protein
MRHTVDPKEPAENQPLRTEKEGLLSVMGAVFHMLKSQGGAVWEKALQGDLPAVIKMSLESPIFTQTGWG